MNPDPEGGLAEELRRIRMISSLAVVLLLLYIVIEGPVTTLGWLLLGAGALSLAYITVASTVSLNNTHRHPH